MRRGGEAGSANRGAHGLLAAVLGCLLSLGLAACADMADENARAVPAAVTVPLAAPKTTGVDSPAMRQHKQVVALYGGEYRWPATERYLNDVLAKLSAASDGPALS